MGNCCRRESSSMVWAGDDWGSLTSKIDEEAAALLWFPTRWLLGLLS